MVYCMFKHLIYQIKTEKTGLIAVINKLLKQAFAIVKPRLPYYENFDSIPITIGVLKLFFLIHFFVVGF